MKNCSCRRTIESWSFPLAQTATQPRCANSAVQPKMDGKRREELQWTRFTTSSYWRGPVLGGRKKGGKTDPNETKKKTYLFFFGRAPAQIKPPPGFSGPGPARTPPP